MQILCTAEEFWFFAVYVLIWFIALGYFTPYDTDSELVQAQSAQKSDTAQAIIDALTLMLFLVLQLSVNVMSMLSVAAIIFDMIISIKRHHGSRTAVNEEEEITVNKNV